MVKYRLIFWIIIIIIIIEQFLHERNFEPVSQAGEWDGEGG